MTKGKIWMNKRFVLAMSIILALLVAACSDTAPADRRGCINPDAYTNERGCGSEGDIIHGGHAEEGDHAAPEATGEADHSTEGEHSEAPAATAEADHSTEGEHSEEAPAAEATEASH